MHKKSTCYIKRTSPLFLRNQFEGQGRWQIPVIRKQSFDLSNISLISIADTRCNDSDANKTKGVHFFTDDYRFEGMYTHPEKSLNKLSQYSFLLSPDFSMYNDMQPWRQFNSLTYNRWLGAYWQSKGLTVFATMTWSTQSSTEFCFLGVEKHSIVAVSTIGSRRSKRGFLYGYDAMLEKIEPEAVICFGKPFDEMKGQVIFIDYIASRRGNR